MKHWRIKSIRMKTNKTIFGLMCEIKMKMLIFIWYKIQQLSLIDTLIYITLNFIRIICTWMKYYDSYKMEHIKNCNCIPKMHALLVFWSQCCCCFFIHFLLLLLSHWYETLTSNNESVECVQNRWNSKYLINITTHKQRSNNRSRNNGGRWNSLDNNNKCHLKCCLAKKKKKC